MTHLRQLMLDELQRCNYSPNTCDLTFTRLRTSPGISDVRRSSLDEPCPRDQVHLFRDCKLSPAHPLQAQTRLLLEAG